MSTEIVKVGRTIRLTSEVNQRLLDLCDHLGTTPNAYLVSEIGKAISRDEVAYKLAGESKAMMDAMLQEVQRASVE